MPIFCQLRKEGGHCERKRATSVCVYDDCDYVMLTLDSYPIKWGKEEK